MKFQPTPSTISARVKCATVSPWSAIAVQAAISATPARITGSTPKRLISTPVTKPGPYMPTTCHSIANAAAPNGCPQKFIAIGVAVIRRFMSP